MFLVLFLSILQSTIVAAGAYNDTLDTNKVVCVYPVSGQYGLLQRLNYYALLLFVVINYKQTWLVSGGLAAIMTYSGVAAIHAFILACVVTKNQAAFDLDIWGCWSVLSVTSILLSPMLEWTVTLRRSRARPLIQVWGLLIAIGTICAYASLKKDYDEAYPCVSQSNGAILDAPPLPGSEQQYNCTPLCFDSYQILRSPSELVVVPKARVFGSQFPDVVSTLGIFMILSTVVGLLACFDDPEKDPSDQIMDNVMRRERIAQKQYERRGGHGVRPRIGNPHKGKDQFLKFKSVVLLASPFLFCAAVIQDERYLLQDGELPTGEKPYAIGQWSCWVATLLVLIATYINRVHEDRKQAVRKATRELLEEDNSNRQKVIASGDVAVASQVLKDEAREADIIARPAPAVVNPASPNKPRAASDSAMKTWLGTIPIPPMAESPKEEETTGAKET